MKRLVFFLALCLNGWMVWAQKPLHQTTAVETTTSRDNPARTDTLSRGKTETQMVRDIISFEGRNFRNYDGFLLDLDAMSLPSAAPATELVPPSLLYNPFANYRTPVNYDSRRFLPDGRITYGATTASGHPSFLDNYFFLDREMRATGLGPFGIGPAPHVPTLRSATFRLNNGWRITTYGEYDAEGNKVRNPSVLPRQHRSFNGAFEMKSENGHFGIHIGVERY